MSVSSVRAVAAAAVVAGAGLSGGGAWADPPSEVETVVVTGTHEQGLTEASSAVPISVYSASALTRSGFADLGRALDQISPSVNLPHSATSPSGANTRAITLKGMSPDQVLVLVNGKRWQTSAVLVFNNAVGRGTAPYDLGAIPESAVERVEVLSDGAAAQYGSDAIAGVVNIILKSNAEGGESDAQTGITDRGDGYNFDLSASQGFALGDDGHLTLSGDLRHQDATNRATIDPAVGRVAQQVGDPRALDMGFAADAGAPLAGGWDTYGSLIVERRDSQSPALFRVPSSSPVLFPHGFLPQIQPQIWNMTAIAGLRGDLGGGFSADLSNSFGYDSAHFEVKNTANAALGAASPTKFYAGTESVWEDTVNLTVTRDLADVLAPGTLAGGLEYRVENYAITDGEPDSYQQGGAQGFPGFAPRIPVDNSRNAFSAFLDLGMQPVKWLSLDGAGRYDDYSDFGNSFTWKGTARADVTDWLAFRGSAGTGFRAPALQQEYFSSVVSQINTSGAFVRTGTYQVRDPIAEALGATPLKAETSHNYTLGAVLQPFDGLLVTGDWYDVDVKNRIILSDQLKGAAVTAVLVAHGVTDVQQVQFFTNAAHTRTEGYEFTVDYTHDIGENTSLDANVEYGQYRTRLLSLATNPVLPALPLLGATSKGLLISAQPLDKLTAAATLTHEPFAATISIEHYGPWVTAPLGAVQSFTDKTLLDVSGRVALTDDVWLMAGILNATDVYPDIVTGGSALGLTYGEESPFGVNGRTYFVRLSLRD